MYNILIYLCNYVFNGLIVIRSNRFTSGVQKKYGSGKTTNLAFIKDYLEQHNISVVVTREPGGTRLAEKIRQLLLD
ncbi:MAG: dTMP kinase, partial [Neobacillus sp.]